MKTCPYCQSVSFDDSEVCYGCLYRFEAKPDTAPILVRPADETAVVSLPTEVSEAITLPDAPRHNFSGMARLHVRMPQGYHYDVYLEKPEGASIQIGWVPDILPPDALVVPSPPPPGS
jgi:hypothetical protein